MAINGSRRLLTVVGTIAIVAVASFAVAQQNILNNPERSDAERARDAGTKPLELYAFFGVESGMTVGDLMPGGGYGTYILSKLVGEGGMVYSGPDRRGGVTTRVEGEGLANVTIIADYAAMPAGSVDVLVTVRNVHDLINRSNATDPAREWLAALKPGGILGVVDARTPKDGFDGNTHRINQQLVIDQITAAGFTLVEASELLANADDNFDESSETGNRYEIDRMVLKFQKAR